MRLSVTVRPRWACPSCQEFKRKPFGMSEMDEKGLLCDPSGVCVQPKGTKEATDGESYQGIGAGSGPVGMPKFGIVRGAAVQGVAERRKGLGCLGGGGGRVSR